MTIDEESAKKIIIALAITSLPFIAMFSRGKHRIRESVSPEIKTASVSQMYHDMATGLLDRTSAVLDTLSNSYEDSSCSIDQLLRLEKFQLAYTKAHHLVLWYGNCEAYAARGRMRLEIIQQNVHPSLTTLVSDDPAYDFVVWAALAAQDFEKAIQLGNPPAGTISAIKKAYGLAGNARKVNELAELYSYDEIRALQTK